MVFTEIINVQNIMLFKNLKMQKLYYIRYKTGYLEDFMYKIDQEWGFFLSMIYEQPMYLDVFKLLKLCSECKIVFGIGNTETDSSFEDAFEFTPGYGGERVVFSQYFMRDEEGQYSYPFLLNQYSLYKMSFIA